MIIKRTSGPGKLALWRANTHITTRKLSSHRPAPRTAALAVSPVGGTIRREQSTGAQVRQELRWFLAEAGASEASQFDILLATGEAIANAIRYGRSETIQWSVQVKADQVVIEVTYATSRFKTTPDPGVEGSLDEGGRGIFLIRSLMDNSHFRFVRGVLRVTLIKRLS